MNEFTELFWAQMLVEFSTGYAVRLLTELSDHIERHKDIFVSMPSTDQTGR